jgi:hypothetical protein
MAKEPWRDSDPQPGDFDAELDRAQIEIHEGDDAKRLERIANERGQQPGEVVSELLRSA